MTTDVRHPPVVWAQREGFLYITFEIDAKTSNIEDLSITESGLHLKATDSASKYEASLEFFAGIDTDSLKRYSNARFLELTINKKEGKWWPRLLKDKAKQHWLKVDFRHWKDEDESGAEEEAPVGAPGGFDLSQYMSQMGGGMGGPPDFDGLEDDEDEDGDMPELEDVEDDEAKAKEASA